MGVRAYRGGVGKDVAKLAERVTALVEQGLDVAEAYALAQGSGTKATRDHARAMEAHAQAVAKHQKRVVDLRSRAVSSAAVAGVAGALGIVDAVSGATASAAAVAADPSLVNGVIPGAPWWWLLGSAFFAVRAVNARHRARTITAPEPPTMSAITRANDLRRDAIGNSEAQALAAVRRQLVTMVPAVASLHPEAGKELKAADDEAAPAFTAQVARLAVLDQVRRELPGSTAATAATDAAEQVRGRLAQGVAVYDRLLAAASTMLGLPRPRPQRRRRAQPRRRRADGVRRGPAHRVVLTPAAALESPPERPQSDPPHRSSQQPSAEGCSGSEVAGALAVAAQHRHQARHLGRRQPGIGEHLLVERSRRLLRERRTLGA